MPALGPKNEAIRSHNVTASECGALMGEHPFMTAGRIFDRLTGRVEDVTPPSLSMEFGSRTEKLLLEFAARELRGIDLLNPAPKLVLNSRTFQHPRVALCATPDAIVTGTRPRHWATTGGDLVELKLSFSRDRWRDGLPKDIEWQARAQMACTRRNRVWVYVFSGIGKLYVVERDHGKERLLTQAVQRFMVEHVATGIRPADQILPEIVYRKRAS